MKVEIVQTNIPGVSLKFSGSKTPDMRTGVVATWHIHDDIEILAGQSGNLEVCLTGTKIDLRPGDIIVINRRVPHATNKTVPYTGTFMLQFRVEKLRQSEFENINKYLALILATNEKEFVYLRHDEPIAKELFGLIDAMYDEYTRRQQEYGMFLEGYMNILLGMLYRNGILENIEHSYNKEALRKIWPTIEYIDNNYNKELTLEKLAATLHMSGEYFCRVFKKATGITPTEYIHYVRIWKAENLLTTTHATILEISMEVGFTSVSYFNRVFKKRKGSTPTEYRSIFRNKAT